MTIKKHLEHFLVYRAYRRGWEAGYRQGVADAKERTPEYVFDLIRAWQTGTPLDFQKHAVPSSVREHLERMFR